MPIPPTYDDFVIAGDVTLHRVQWGTSGPAIVCVHGLTANAFCYQAFADQLAFDHQVIAYDLRGRGDSDRPEQGYSIPIHAQDLANLIDELELDRPIIVGHSLGALISLNFASHYPEKLSKLVLIDAGAPLPWKTADEQPLWLKSTAARLTVVEPSFETYVQKLKNAPYLGEYWNPYIDIYFQHDARTNEEGGFVPKCYIPALVEEAQHADESHPEEQWAAVQVPTLLMRAGQQLNQPGDQLLTEEAAKHIETAIKDCHYVNYPDLNHYTIMFGVQKGPADEVRKFIDD